MKKGWIKLYRKLQDHWLWDDRPFSKGQAWIDMLLLANHDDNKFLLGNELVEVKCGSFITSIEKLKVRWGWSNTKVVNFLKLLEKDEMITKKSDTKKTLITIENYDKYSIQEKEKTMRERCENDTGTMREHTNKNEKNDKNEKNNIYIGVPDDLKEAFSEFSNMRKKIKKPISSKRTVTRILNKLDELATTTGEKNAILNQSTDNCWQDVYPLKGDKPNGQYAKNSRDNGKAFDNLDIPTF